MLDAGNLVGGRRLVSVMRRRDLLRLAGIVPAATLVTWLSACDHDSAPPVEQGDGPRDLIVVRTVGGVALVDANLGRIVAGPGPGVAAWDGSASVTGSSAQGRTTVEVLDGTGGRLRRVELDGKWRARVVSPRGGLVALANPGESSAYLPLGRSSTTIVVLGRGGERRYDLPGCLEPEAFSATGDYLYTLDYVPPTAPDRYRVRVLNLQTGTFDSLLARDKTAIPPGAEEEMRGEGRQAVYVPSLNFLITLYTHQPEHEHTRDLIAVREGAADVHAFVHSLSLDQSYAYCIDLLEPFGYGPAEGHAIAVARNGTDPIVVDTTSGALAEIDGNGLTVRQVVGIGASTQEGPAAAAVGRLIYVGRGTNVRAFQSEGFAQVAEFTVAKAVCGLGDLDD
jgi:hypothetical protein